MAPRPASPVSSPTAATTPPPRRPPPPPSPPSPAPAAKWRRLADVVRAARSGVDLPPAAAELTDRQLFHAAGWPTKLVLGPLLARVGTGGGSMPSGTGRAGNPFLAGDDRAAEVAEHAVAE